MKKRLIIAGIGVLVIAAIVAIVLSVVLTREGVVLKSGWLGSTLSYVKNDTWVTSASDIHGNCRVDVTLNSDNLTTFHANSTNSGGKVRLKLIQGDVEKSIDLTGKFDDKIDMGDFKAGRIRLLLEFEHAEIVTTIIKW